MNPKNGGSEPSERLSRVSSHVCLKNKAVIRNHEYVVRYYLLSTVPPNILTGPAGASCYSLNLICNCHEYALVVIMNIMVGAAQLQ